MALTNGAARIPDAVLQAFPGTPAAPVDPASFAGVNYRSGSPAAVLDTLTQELAGFFDDALSAGFDGLLVGLSGGIDSLMCAELCRRALPADRIVAATVVFDPPDRQISLAALEQQARALGIAHVSLPGEPTLQAMTAAWPESGPWSAINIETRCVQSLLFQLADARNFLVCATTDRSELLLGRFTEVFYGHVAPLHNLYKTEVEALAAHCGIMPLLADSRPGCPGHWYDDEVLGASYAVIDPLLHLLAEGKLSTAEIASRHGIADRGWLEGLRQRLHSQRIRVSTRALGGGEQR